MPKAPAVVVDKSGHRVRLRGLDYALPYTVMGSRKDGNGNEIPFEIKGSLQPNRWTTVEPEVYEMLQRKFSKPRETAVTDWDERTNERFRTVEEQLSYVIEGIDEEK